MSKQVKYVNLGRSGLKVSQIILGCMSYGSSAWRAWVLNEEESIKHIEEAFRLGINTFDTADAYSSGQSEVVLGKALKQLKIPRPEVVILTKCYFAVGKTVDAQVMGKNVENEGYVNMQGLSRKHIFDSVHASLERLQVDYIDVLQCHRFDPNTPIEETMQALHDVVKAGFVRYIGMSSCYAWQFQIMQQYAIHNKLTPFVSMQNLYNAIHREEEREMMPTLQHFGVASIPWSPLARGYLTRPHTSQPTTRQSSDAMINRLSSREKVSNEKINEAISTIASNRGASMAQIALAYTRSKDFITAPIIGSTKLESIKDLVEGLKITLDEQEIKAIEEHYTPRAVFAI